MSSMFIEEMESLLEARKHLKYIMTQINSTYARIFQISSPLDAPLSVNEQLSKLEKYATLGYHRTVPTHNNYIR